MKLLDRNTSEFFGVDTAILMERAALAVADVATKWVNCKGGGAGKERRKYRVLVLFGTGNNGADGICAARLLKQRGMEAVCCIVGDPTRMSDLCIRQTKIAEKYGVIFKTLPEVTEGESFLGYDIIIDALFGVGLSRPLAGDSLKACDFINRCKEERGSDIYVVSVDIPSGISADTGEIVGGDCAVRADATVTFNFPKLGHIFYPGCEYAGVLTIADVGITKESFLDGSGGFVYYDGEAKDLIPERRKDSNKGTNGKVLIVAGSKDISGACILAASACLRSGAGMVRVFTAAENAETVRTLLPEAIVDLYEDFEVVAEKLKKAMDWSTQAVVGPGIGTEGKGREILTHILKEYDKNLALDADALNLIAEDEELFKLASDYAKNGKELILTPHMGEFSRLCKKGIRECKKNAIEYSKELAGKLHATIICKDARTIVADSREKKIYINVSGNDGMATAGSGDVLSGILGSLLNADMDSFEIAAAAAYIHGRAGDTAAKERGRYSMVASDIIAALPEVFDATNI